MATSDVRRTLVELLVHLVFVAVVLTIALRLVSQPSTPAVVFGSALLIALAIIYGPRLVVLVRRLWPTLFAVLLLGLCSCARIEPGHVGVQVHLYGGSKGVDVEPLGVGMQWYNPFTSSIYEYPTFVQTAVWTRDDIPTSPGNEEITFTSDGMVISTDISLSYHLEAAKVPEFFAKFRSDSLSTFTHGFLHNVARDAFNETAVKYSVEQVYGSHKEVLLQEVRARINATCAAYGVVIEQFGVIGAMRLPEQVVTALNSKIKATQDAIRVENELRQAEAEAKKTVAKAKGEADARLTQADAEARANRLVAASITTDLVLYEAVRRWNGQRPTVEGAGSGLLLQLTPGK